MVVVTFCALSPINIWIDIWFHPDCECEDMLSGLSSILSVQPHI